MKRIIYWLSLESLSKQPFWIILFLMFVGSPQGVSSNIQEQPVDTTDASLDNLKAIDFARSKNYDSAITYLEKAAAGYLKENIWDRFFYAHNQIGYLFNAQYKYKQTFQHLDSIENLYADHLSAQLNSYQEFYGVLAWSQFSLYDYEKALYYFEIVDNGAEINNNVNPRKILFSKYYQGVIYLRIGQYDQALKLMLLTKEYGDEKGDSFYLGRAYNNLGIIYRNLGEYERALEYYQKALEVERQTNEEVSLTPLYNNIGMIYYYLENYDATLKEVDYALDVLRRVTSDYYSVESALINTKAKVLIEQQKYLEAQTILDQVLIREVSSYGENWIGRGPTLHNLGNLYSRMKKYPAANDYYDLSITITQSAVGPKTDKLAEMLNQKAQNFIDIKDYDAALQTVQQSIISLAPDFNDLNFRVNPTKNAVILDKVELIETQYLKSKVLLAMFSDNGDVNYLQAAEAANQTAMAFVDIVRTNMLYESSKMNLSKRAKTIYEQSIDIAFLLEKGSNESAIARVFEAMENSKAYILSEAIQKAKALGYSNLPESIVFKEDSFRTKLKVLKSRQANILLQSKDSVALAIVNEQLFTIKEAFEDYKQSYAAEKSVYQHNMLKISDFQANFAENELIIEYFAGESQLYCIAISKKNVSLYELGDYRELINEFTVALRQVRSMDADAYQQQANEVYKTILAPVLADYKGAQRLVIIPDKQLGFIPFDALITGTVDNPRYNSLKYLLKDYTLMQHQTVALYAGQQHHHEKTTEQFIGFAPDFDENELLAVANNQLRNVLQPLPFAKKEVETISNLLGGEEVTGARASEAYLKSKAASFNILHLATHAIIDEENPLYSKLVFALGDSTLDEDGELHSFEIYGMKLNSALVTLSACNTGTGKYLDGEGIFSLGRSFLLAGAESVLTSLWEVSDLSTSQIMASFYDNIKKGETSPEAIRMAKLAYLSSSDPTTANPHYWAGFVYIGQSENVFDANRNYYWFTAFGLLFIGTVLLTIKLKKKSSYKAE